MFDERKTLYRRHLESQGFTSTRADDLDVAVKKLHLAICQIDLSPTQLKALKRFLSSDIRDVINEFATIEELRKGF